MILKWFKRKQVCPACSGDGKDTCNNPDHGFMDGFGGAWIDGHANGCPVCGNDPEHKVPNGGNCNTCNGRGWIK